jgi:hypothetical protein
MDRGLIYVDFMETTCVNRKGSYLRNRERERVTRKEKHWSLVISGATAL